MLEEALSSPTFPPSEAALALLSFLRYELPAGGTAAERRFIRLFPLLCHRVFGPLSSADDKILQEFVRHESGGWLSRAKWTLASSKPGGAEGAGVRGSTSTASSVVARGVSSTTGVMTQEQRLKNDPIVQLLSAFIDDDTGGGRQPTLIDAISAETIHRPGVRFALSFKTLPYSTQVVLLSLVDLEMFQHCSESLLGGVDAGVVVKGKENANLLFGRVIRVKPVEQMELRIYLQKMQQLSYGQYGHHSPRGGLHHYGGSGMSQSPPYSTRGVPRSSSSPMAVSPMGGNSGQAGRFTSPHMLSPQNGPLADGSSSTNGGGVTTNGAVTTATPNIMLSMLEYYLLIFIRFPLAVGATPSTSNQTSSIKENQRKSPAASTQQPQSQPTYNTTNTSSSSSISYSYYHRRNETSYGEAAYIHLFRGYLKHYLPHTPSYLPPPPPLKQSWRRTTSSSSSTSVDGGSFSDYGGDATTRENTSSSIPPPPLVNFAPLNRESELFLRYILEFWLESSSLSSSGRIVPTTSFATNYILQRRGLREGMMPFDLDMSFDLAQGVFVGNNGGIGAGGGVNVPMQVQKGIKYLVNHLVGDPGIKQAVFAASGGGSGSSRGGGIFSRGDSMASASSNTTPPSSSPPTATSSSSTGSGRWCLTPAMTTVQPSFYNYIRMTFRHAPVHLNGSPFFSALRAWLVWIEPWNVYQRKRNIAANFSTSKAKDVLFSAAAAATASVTGTTSIDNTSTSHRLRQIDTSTQSMITYPKPTHKSKFTSDWEPYIAANLHLYTVPLAIFLRRARELDFSTKSFRNSLSYVQSVFRVFCPPVMDVIDRLLSNSGSSSSVLGPLVRHHERLLGEFRPPQLTQGLEACSQDAHNLLEEIFLQHQKTVRELDFLDRLASRLEGLAGQGMVRDEGALDKLVWQARNIVKFPLNYEVLPNDMGGPPKVRTGTPAGGRGGGGFVDSMRPERVSDGYYLTDKGRQQILVGSKKCSALDVTFIGDPMYARVKSYEISFLVDWTVQLSHWLNCTLGLVVEDRNDAIGDGYLASVKRFLKDLNLKRFIWFRINLRFLADYRNIFFMSILYMCRKALK